MHDNTDSGLHVKYCTPEHARFLHLLGSNVQVLKKAKIIIQNIEEGFLKLYIFLNLFKAVTNILKKTGLK